MTATERTPYELGEDGTSKSIYDYGEAIREFVYVEMPFDGDGDGANDLIRVDIIRPRELDGVAKVPSIMEPSPYYGTLGRHNEDKEYARPDMKADSRLNKFPWWIDNYFTPRGYAVILPETSGTNLSQGFCDIGGPRDIGSLKAVVDWLNGRARAFWTRDDRSDANLAVADWSNGLVGAIGKSYDGSIANGLAATGVEGLTTIVPISAISDQYQWYHPYGALLAGDDDEQDGGWWEPGPFAQFLESPLESKVRRFDTGGMRASMIEGADKKRRCFTDFWRERDYRSHVPEFKASVFLIHGVNDYNVMMNQVDKYWHDLSEAGVPRKIWLHQYAHDDPFDVRRDEWVRTIHRWFDYWLMGIDNGIMDEPMASVEGTDGVWHDEATWPAADAKDVTFGVQVGVGKDGDGELMPAAGASQPEETRSEGSPTLSVKGARVHELATLDEGDHGRKDGRLLFVGKPLDHAVRLSGSASLRLRVRSTEPDTNLACSLIELGEGLYVAPSDELHAMVELKEKTTVGESGDNDKAEYPLCVPRRVVQSAHVVTRGWIGLPHRNDWAAYDPMPADGTVEVTVPLLASDWTIPAGHRLALAIYNTSTKLAPVPLADLEIDPDSIEFTLPLAG